eukprot:180013-Pyramimonas_sp.AAC.1
MAPNKPRWTRGTVQPYHKLGGGLQDISGRPRSGGRGLLGAPRFPSFGRTPCCCRQWIAVFLLLATVLIGGSVNFMDACVRAATLCTGGCFHREGYCRQRRAGIIIK